LPRWNFRIISYGDSYGDRNPPLRSARPSKYGASFALIVGAPRGSACPAFKRTIRVSI
jgi:hypothetical protein